MIVYEDTENLCRTSDLINDAVKKHDQKIQSNTSMMKSIIDQTRLSIQNIVQERKKTRIKKMNELSYTSNEQMTAFR